ncbi:hypothetical protein Forpi1262_v017758 [Fusarium oxysporum f. sp. raphani]|uniref:Effector protein PevD1 n=1 Tax=Fusarium oxysporum f. sp. raphani TaxID=96318 RepID=A0A8J5TT84_FUSOX|nr:hypothetical protein Forpi1262_v017758 [Fusarium oxysporum f. sp. raphani]KAJ0138757.1 hypothetical protein HZ326_18276 [Fusarium oxysporum f. sp. albedinis]KAK2474819.1 hypothetical protein H9L39_14779 [Fusarium oxysporum f. sp. albedinis]
MFVTNVASSFLVLCRLAVAFPHPSVPQANSDILIIRASEEVNPNAVTDTTCLNLDAAIDFHDQNVATLSICGGIQGATEKCGGAPTSTTGQSGTAKFTLNPTVAGATINVSKGRWEGCIRAARAVCPTGSFKSVCKGGASEGDIAFTLDNP